MTASKTARTALLEATVLVEGLRPSVAAAIGMVDGKPNDPVDQSIIDAWQIARAELRAACKAYVEEASR